MALRVMVVDDEPEVLKLFKVLVEPLGFEVLAFTDGREADERIKKEKFDGVFLDARMPPPDGFELTKSVRASPLNSRVPIVMVTGRNDVDTMRQGFLAGITFFLGKPINQPQLSVLLRTMRRAMLREKRRYARLPFRTVVTILSGHQSFQTESVDISEGGMMMEESGGAELGQEVDLEFMIFETPHPIRPRAKVVRREPSQQIAVQFLALKPEEREAIQNYIRGMIRE